MKNIFYPVKDVNKFLRISLCSFIFLFSFHSFSQQPVAKKNVLDTLVTVHFEHASLKECLSKLTETYSVNFSYINDEIPLQKQIQCHFVDTPLQVVLDAICKQANIRYFSVGTQIVLKNQEQIAVAAIDSVVVVSVDSITAQPIPDTTINSSRDRSNDTYQMNKKYRKYFFSMFGKRRVPDSMIIVSSSGTDTIKHTEETKKYRYVNRSSMYPRFSIGAYGGGGVAYRNLSGDDWYATERNSDEHSVPNYIFGSQLTYYLKSVHVSFRSGLQYTTFGEKGTYKEILLIPPPQSQPSGPPTEIIITHSYQNRYNYLMLPFMAGYSFNLYRRLGVSVYSGLSMAFLLSNRSTFEQGSYGNVQNPQNVMNRNPFIHTYNNVSLVFPVQAEFFYRLSMRVHIVASSAFNYFLTSIYSKNDLSCSRPYAFDFSIGVNYFFKMH